MPFEKEFKGKVSRVILKGEVQGPYTYVTFEVHGVCCMSPCLSFYDHLCVEQLPPPAFHALKSMADVLPKTIFVCFRTKILEDPEKLQSDEELYHLCSILRNLAMLWSPQKNHQKESKQL